MYTTDTNAVDGTFSSTALHQFFTRDVQSTLTPNATQRTTLIVAGCYILVIGILWHIPILSWISEMRHPFLRLLTVGFHEMSHAFMGVLTCAHIHSIELDPDEGGATSMSGGIPYLTLPAGYLGSSLIGAALIACGFDTNASKIASIVLAVFFLFTLWWAKRDWLTWVLILGMSGLIVLFWFVAGGVALRYLVLFIGVMSCMYCLWDIIDDTISRKVNSSDASQFAKICGCCPSQVWGVLWLFISLIFFIAGVLVGLAAFKESAEQQKEDSSKFLPVPGSSGAIAPTVAGYGILSLISATVVGLLGIPV
ncbi:peptidase M50B-like-domain-containing protein [Lentinula raphanica]|uniref:Peptidase M50B-like-domain-containing protein n=1 Tax=Lentinula raphanica TaxID=153919 RepID=A0AA38UH84_9AGAR|nr:peptidase M50B-like-domain-containing protein [Lentinula raphanica]KAJ3841110.1 peptidase M50B-like-domain-containing protein [Lentinula raphanica]